MRRLITALATLWLLASPAMAQMAATLVADSLTLSPDNRLTARGNVEAFHAGTRLSAAAITYDRRNDILQITGPIFIETADGAILTATEATLDPRLRDGLLRGARLVLNQQLQLAAQRIDRAEGRYSQLTRTAVTSCAVCGTAAPLWEIRAHRVIHDAEEQQLYFDNASLRIRGLPVFWVPYMRLPDPTLDRSRGLLRPELRSSDRLGVGIALPYFIPFGDSADLTLTPFVAPGTRTLEARWRQAYAAGEITLDAALSDDDLGVAGLRGYARAQGRFDLSADWRLAFDLMTVSDPAYLLHYDLSDQDRIASTVDLLRVTADGYDRAQIIGWQSLREGESAEARPPVIAAYGHERRQDLGAGVLTWGASAEARIHPDAGDGADLLRAATSAGWRADRVFGPGVLATLDAGFGVEARRQDGGSTLRALPAADITLRWPLARDDAGGGRQVLEPMAMIGWRDALGDAVTNEDGLMAEFDEGNLLDPRRLPGSDGAETGAVGALGLGWTRIAPGGGALSLTFGRAFMAGSDADFSQTTGLDGTRSDWLIAGGLTSPGGFGLQGRALLDDAFGATKAEARLDWSAGPLGMAAGYLWLPQDAAAGRAAALSEWSVAADWRINPQWEIRGSGRYDVANDQPIRAGFGVVWSNECVTVDLSATRRYTQTETADPSTSFGLSVTLNGFSAAAAGVPRADCRG